MPPAFMKSSYSGRDGIMECFLVFNKDGTVEFRRIYGWFQELEKNSKVFLNDTMTNKYFSAWSDSIQGNYKNIIFVCDVIEYEAEINKNNRSEVKAIYLLNIVK